MLEWTQSPGDGGHSKPLFAFAEPGLVRFERVCMVLAAPESTQPDLDSPDGPCLLVDSTGGYPAQELPHKVHLLPVGQSVTRAGWGVRCRWKRGGVMIPSTPGRPLPPRTDRQARSTTDRSTIAARRWATDAPAQTNGPPPKGTYVPCLGWSAQRSGRNRVARGQYRSSRWSR